MLRRIGHGPETLALLAFGDPFTTPLAAAPAAARQALPRHPDHRRDGQRRDRAGENLLIRNDQTYDEGMVGVTLSGPVVVDTVVAKDAGLSGTR